jgi:hypothetical protein
MNAHAKISIARSVGTNHKPLDDSLLRKLDCYSTCAIAVKELMKLEEFDKNIWEPANGEGKLSRVLKKHGHNVFTSDIKRWHDSTEVQRSFHKFTRLPYGEFTDIITKLKTSRIITLPLRVNSKRYRRVLWYRKATGLIDGWW